MSGISVLIVARDAANTVGEALASALAEPVDEVVVVDDVSSDATAEVAMSTGDPRVRLLLLAEHRTLGFARQAGLEAVSGEFCFLLDADDVFLPGRIERLTGALSESGADFVADELELIDGASGASLRRLSIPAFLDRPPGLARLFERNYLPGIGQIGFRTETMKRVRYDATLQGGEDSDLVMRALLAGARGCLVREVGYRMRHFAGSVSRDRFRQGRELAKALRGYDPDAVESLLARAGMKPRLRAWSMLSFSLFRRSTREAVEWLGRLEDEVMDPATVLEREGPFPYEEGWRLDFAAGSIALASGDASMAEERLRRAAGRRRSAETLNNLGVAAALLGRAEEAAAFWREALSMRPDYADAADNLAGAKDGPFATLHPFRREASRSEYRGGNQST